jgi:hypothetical protein
MLCLLAFCRINASCLVIADCAAVVPALALLRSAVDLPVLKQTQYLYHHDPHNVRHPTSLVPAAAAAAAQGCWWTGLARVLRCGSSAWQQQAVQRQLRACCARQVSRCGAEAQGMFAHV